MHDKRELQGFWFSKLTIRGRWNEHILLFSVTIVAGIFEVSSTLHQAWFPSVFGYGMILTYSLDSPGVSSLGVTLGTGDLLAVGGEGW